MCKLTPKRRRFVDEYLIDCNAAAAFRRAGYASKNADVDGAKLLVNASIQEAIAKRQAALAKKAEVSQEKVLAEYARIGFAKLTDYVVWGGEKHETVTKIGGEEGIQIVDESTLIATFTPSTDLTPDQAAAISELSITKEGSVKIKLHDKKGALDSICKMLGFNAPEKTDITSKGKEITTVVFSRASTEPDAT
jgi:phage terminase small subunit